MRSSNTAQNLTSIRVRFGRPINLCRTFYKRPAVCLRASGFGFVGEGVGAHSRGQGPHQAQWPRCLGLTKPLGACDNVHSF